MNQLDAPPHGSAPWPQGPQLTVPMPGDCLYAAEATVSADVSALGQSGARLLGLINAGRNRVMARPWRMRRLAKHRANRCERAAVDRRGAELSKREQMLAHRIALVL